MYCENCGKEFSERQKYCTRCGIDTDSGSQVLSTGSFESLLEELHAISYSLERLRPLADSAHILASRITKQLIHRREEILDKFAKALDVTEVVETPERVSYLRDSARSLIGSGEEIDELLGKVAPRTETRRSSPDLAPTPEGRAIWVAVLSENTMAALLGLGVLLIAVSSLVMLVTLWSDFGWLIKQAFLLAQLAAFVGVGHVVKQRMGLHYSGLALISVGAFWALFSSGTAAFEFIEPKGDVIVPGIGLPLDLPSLGWLIITVPAAIVWAGLAFKYKGHVLTNGSAILALGGLGFLIPSFGLEWHWGLGAVAIGSSVITYFSNRLYRLGMNEAGKYLFWSSQVLLLMLLFIALQAWGVERVSLYPVGVILGAGAITSAIVLHDRASQAYNGYTYCLLLLPPAALIAVMLEWEVVPKDWFGLLPAAAALFYAMLCTKYLAMLRRFSFGRLVDDDAWSNPIFASAILACVGACLWPDFDQLSKAVTLLVITPPLWVTLRSREYDDLMLAAGIPIVGGFLLLLNLASEPWGLSNMNTAWVAFAVSLLSGGIFLLINKLSRKDSVPFLSAAALLSLVAVAMSGWGAWANWEGFSMSLVYGAIAIVAAQFSNSVIAATLGVFWMSVAGGFAMGMLGFYRGERAVGWAVEALVLLWGSQLLGKVKGIKRFERGELWTRVMRFSSLRLSWFALGYVIFMAAGGLFSSDNFGETEWSITAITLSIVGLAYTGMSFLDRSHTFGYLGVGLLLLGWILQGADWELGQAQAYAIPAGLYLLGIAYAERRRREETAPETAYYYSQQVETEESIPASPFVEVLAVLVMGLSSFIQSTSQDPEWVYAVLLGLEGIGFIVWGAATRSKVLMISGVLLFGVDVIYQATSLLSSFGGAIIAAVIGVALLVLVLVAERFRARLIEFGNRWIRD